MREAENKMTDPTPRRTVRPLDGPASRETGTPERGARRRSSVAGGRIAAAGIGIAAMLGLVANMQVSEGQTKAPAPAPTTPLATKGAPKGLRSGAVSPGQVAMAKVNQPIVLTPHTVVHSVAGASSSSGSSGGYSGGYSASYSAPAAAPAAPVASTSGSH